MSLALTERMLFFATAMPVNFHLSEPSRLNCLLLLKKTRVYWSCISTHTRRLLFWSCMKVFLFLLFIVLTGTLFLFIVSPLYSCFNLFIPRPTGWDSLKKIGILEENLTKYRSSDAYSVIIPKPLEQTKPTAKEPEITAVDEQVCHCFNFYSSESYC